MDKIYSWFKDKKGTIYVLRDLIPSTFVKNISLKDEDGTKTINLELEDSSHIFISKENLTSKEICGFNSFEMVSNIQSVNGDTIHVVLENEEEFIFTTSEDIGEDWGEYLFTKRPPKMIPYEKKSENGWPMRLLKESDDYIHIVSIAGNEKIREIIKKLSLDGKKDVIMLYHNKTHSMTLSEKEMKSVLQYALYPYVDTFVVVAENEAPSIVFDDKDEIVEIPNKEICYVRGEDDECFFFTNIYKIEVIKSIFENPESRAKFIKDGEFSRNELAIEEKDDYVKQRFNKKYFVDQMSNRKQKIAGFFEDEYIFNKTKSRVDDFLLNVSFLRKTKGDDWIKENLPDLEELKNLF